jgi:hypothetical protein
MAVASVLSRGGDLVHVNARRSPADGLGHSAAGYSGDMFLPSGER